MCILRVENQKNSKFLYLYWSLWSKNTKILCLCFYQKHKNFVFLCLCSIVWVDLIQILSGHWLYFKNLSYFSVAWAYGSTQALPFTTIIVLGLVWLTIGYPGTVIGGIIGKNTQQSFDEPCRTKNISRYIPAVPWYRTTLAHMVIGGFLPFSAISVELYYIFTTLWGRDQYTLYGILAVVFMILLCVTACISVALTYYQLASEDNRWWWRSIVSSG